MIAEYYDATDTLSGKQHDTDAAKRVVETDGEINGIAILITKQMKSLIMRISSVFWKERFRVSITTSAF